VLAGVVAALGLEAIGLAPAQLNWVPFAAAAAVSVLVGVTVGSSAARRAARLNPATAVRVRTA
jgi:ABC-type antimicrobial peptide transport system permease subunit